MRRNTNYMSQSSPGLNRSARVCFLVHSSWDAVSVKDVRVGADFHRGLFCHESDSYLWFAFERPIVSTPMINFPAEETFAGDPPALLA